MCVKPQRMFANPVKKYINSSIREQRSVKIALTNCHVPTERSAFVAHTTQDLLLLLRLAGALLSWKEFSLVSALESYQRVFLKRADCLLPDNATKRERLRETELGERCQK